MISRLASLKFIAVLSCFLALAACSKKNTPDLNAGTGPGAAPAVCAAQSHLHSHGAHSDAGRCGRTSHAATTIVVITAATAAAPRPPQLPPPARMGSPHCAGFALHFETIASKVASMPDLRIAGSFTSLKRSSTGKWASNTARAFLQSPARAKQLGAIA
mgnify:CR=1 FL=1